MSEKEVTSVMSFLDVPESTLDNILERLSDAELCIMSQVCTYLWYRCASDYLWNKMLKRKWSKLVGDVAREEWYRHVESRKKENLLVQFNNPSGSCLKDSRKSTGLKISDDSAMALYVSLETGRFWFPAQAYTRGGLIMYCYDVLLSYDSRTNTFRARYRPDPYGWQKIEENIMWDRVRALTVENSHDAPQLYDCLNELAPGDHIEIQWRASKDSPYDWSYARIGHLASCFGNENECLCRSIDVVMLEFKQYSMDSSLIQVEYNRNRHDEQAVEEEAGGGFNYGRVRKLHSEEIAWWETLLAFAD